MNVIESLCTRINTISWFAFKCYSAFKRRSSNRFERNQNTRSNDSFPSLLKTMR